MATASEQTSTNVQSIASASEGLSASVGEISRQVQHSSQLSQEAVETADKAGTTIRDLSAASDQIGSVLDFINNIASQTKLLSLNATIEAARVTIELQGALVGAPTHTMPGDRIL